MKRSCFLILLAGVLPPQVASAQPAPTPPPTVILVRPAAAPVPALKYRLVPERRALTSGNAAIFYHRAIQFVIQVRSRAEGAGQTRPGAYVPSIDEQIAQWTRGPISELPRQEARKRLETFRSALNEIELGVMRSTCDWEFDQRKEGIGLLLPDIQEMRTLSRLVALKARLAILDGKTDEAMHWIETGFVMGRHVAQGPIAIQALVGVAIDYVMTGSLEDLIQAPGTPSLYWALADRPRPFVDMRYPLEGERYLLENELPALGALDRAPWSLEETRQFADQFQRKLFPVAAGEPIPGTRAAVPSNMPGLARRLAIAAMAAKIYPEARRGLITAGRPEAEVGAMPVVQVAALYSLKEYERVRDERYKWLNVPYWQSYDRFDRAGSGSVKQKLANPLLTMFEILAPALNSIRLASLRVDRQLDALESIEAIRLYAAAHEGKLPPTLDAIREAPVPLDPATGKAFSYTADGDSATLSAPVAPGAPNHPSYAVHYELKLAK